jgi:hypothetical protein
MYTGPGFHKVAPCLAVLFIHVSLCFPGAVVKCMMRWVWPTWGTREIRTTFCCVNMKERSHMVDLEIDERVNTKINLKNMWEERGQV